MSESRPIDVGFRKPPETPRPGPTTRVRITNADGVQRDDFVATEEPLEIRVNHRGAEHVIAVTMRTPGNDFELAVGFLFGEGLIEGNDDIATVSYCKSGPPEQLYNIVSVDLRDQSIFDPTRAQRNFYTSSSCGVCGKASIEAVNELGCAPLVSDAVRVSRAVLGGLPDALRAKQAVFEKTGGLHAAGVFNADGTMLVSREDVGRHNAVDKCIGWLVMNGEVADLLQVSGRASFEIIQKALRARIPVVSAVGAPSSLAVQLAEQFHQTLTGFSRGARFNIYTGADRATD